MKCIFIQQRVFKNIDESYAATDTTNKRIEMNELAMSALILNLSDSVLRKVEDIDYVKDLWKKLNDLFTETSLSCKMFHLEKFF